ncbi:MAG: 4-hydroxy-tetrahydrodipicolinate synthase [Nitrososphaerota archaeon]|jgi:4-hydroxy-tetrahydrodipicolinate synthase|nr:4-hydroxy-tetrahydrodipicolinate synthase [Nitrososphaerota archaeon]
MFVFNGCTTALITPMNSKQKVDYDGLQRLIDFQLSEGVNGLLAVGTTGESPTLNWTEHSKVIEKTREHASEQCFTIAGTGSNSTQEAINGTQHAKDVGITAVLLVDPYYNGPSSMEIRREYIEPIVKQFPDIQIIPYIIPGRTGTQLFPQDLAILHQQYPNVRCVKEATGNIENMILIRQYCGADFEILSGDDDQTYVMMTNHQIKATGAISVVSNIAPRAVTNMIQYVLKGNTEAAAIINHALQPLFNIVTVKTQETTPYGPVTCKARNPLAFKTLMNILGMPSGPCRQPLGKMTRAGIEIILTNARKVYTANPQVLEPIAAHFDVDLNERLYNEKYLEGLMYA